MIKKLVCFDFDGTLIDTPFPETGKPLWEESTQQKWNGRGWWGNPESLNVEIFEPKVNPWVFEQFQIECSDKNSFVFVATGRLQKLYDQVVEVLDFNGIKIRKQIGDLGLDAIHCNTGHDTFIYKCRLFEKLIRENPTADHFTMYDDREKHLEKFVEWSKSQPIQIKIIDSINQKQIN